MFTAHEGRICLGRFVEKSLHVFANLAEGFGVGVYLVLFQHRDNVRQAMTVGREFVAHLGGVHG